MKIHIEFTNEEINQSIHFTRKAAPEMADKAEEAARESMSHMFEAHSCMFDVRNTPPD